MKKMYWTAHNLHPYLMILLCIVALACGYVVEKYKTLKPEPYYKLMLKASSISQNAMSEVKKQRLSLGIKINPEFDPAESGLIGEKFSSITSDKGVLRSKQISINPNIAGLVIIYLKDLKLKKGDTVALGMTGSFPGLNINTLAAIKAMGLNPLIIVSGAASQWGANIPGLLWIDMYQKLQHQAIFPYPILAASIGSAKDMGVDLDSKGVDIISNTIKKYQIPLIENQSVRKSIDERMSFYDQAANNQPIKAYINIGGGVASVGKHWVKDGLSEEVKKAAENHSLVSGVNLSLPIQLANTDSVAVRYLKQGIPVINLKDIKRIAEHYHLQPWQKSGHVGLSGLYVKEQYNILLAILGLIVIFGILVLVTIIIKKKVIAENQI